MKLGLLLLTFLLAAPSDPADDFIGLWKAKRRFGPDARGPLVLEKSPVRLEPDGVNRWRGNVEPRHDTFTLFPSVRKRPDGTVGAFLRNPERNIGIFHDVDRLVRDGRKVDLIGKWRGAKEESTLLSGVYDPEREVLSIVFSGVQLLPRDFMKLGQLMLDGGTWQGRRILGRDFVTRASSPLHDLSRIQYGYLWWSIDYPYKDRTTRAFFAGGNGGQGIMVVPELGLVIATFGGSYGDKGGLYIQQELAPEYILPAVREPGRR